MCYCNSLACSGGCSATFGGLIDGIDYYTRTASGYNLMCRQTYNPMEEAYRIALRSLEYSYAREMQNMFQYAPFDDYYYRDRKEYEIRGHFERDKNRLYDDFRNASQQYMYRMANQGYGYGLRQNRLPRYTNWDFGASQPYTYTYQYINSKETTPVPTETKKWIIISSEGPNDNPKTHTTLAEAEKEAQRLARKFPTQEFTIYETKKAYKIAEKPVDVKHFI